MRRGESLTEWMDRIDERNYRLAATEHYVYRAWDENGILLYVGCSVNVERRMGSHRSTATWAPFVASVTVDGPYPSRDEGRAAESAAIESEGAFFTATKADAQRTQANRRAAYRALANIGIHAPECSQEALDAILNDGDPAAWDIHEAEASAYRSLVDEMRDALKAGAFPYLTDGDRLDNYLAARSARRAS